MATRKKTTTAHRDKARQERKESNRLVLPPDAEIIQQSLVDEGYVSVVEILFRATNDVYEDLQHIGKVHGITSPEYEKAVKHLNDLAKTTSPFFVKEKDKTVVLDTKVEDEIKSILDKRRKSREGE